MAVDRWTEDQLIQAMVLYCKTSFGRIHSRNPEVIALAARLGRTPSALALKMANFAALDPTLDRRGMANASALDREVWGRFYSNMAEYVDEVETPVLPAPQQVFEYPGFREDAVGYNVNAVRTERRGQSFFRKMILASYDGRCALSGVENPALLVASHIEAWADNPDLRLKPTNGICLNPLLDRAFEKGLIGFDAEHRVLYSKNLEPVTRQRIESNSSDQLRLPRRFLPDPDLLREHRTRFQLG